MSQVVTFNPRILKVPYVIFIAVVAFAAYQRNWWLLLGVPLIYLGWVSASPNLNLANGCLPQVVFGASILGMFVFGRDSLPIGLACWLSWLLCSLELAWRCETGRTGT